LGRLADAAYARALSRAKVAFKLMGTPLQWRSASYLSFARESELKRQCAISMYTFLANQLNIYKSILKVFILRCIVQSLKQTKGEMYMITIDNKNTDAVCVLTARGIEMILAEGGSQAWVLDGKRARACGYVICVQNRGFADDWGKVSAPHHTAFLVGKLKDVVRSQEEDCENRWLLTFSEYAEIDMADAWPGNRNPVLYTSLEQFGITLADLNFQPMPDQEIRPAAQAEPLTIAQAKAGLARTFGVSPAEIEITVRA
jgi:hypothetical protein